MMTTTPGDGFIGGVDSHKDTIHAAVINHLGREVADREFPTTATGYRAAVTWLRGHGPLHAVGVEGTSSYGVGVKPRGLSLGALTEPNV